MAEKQVSMLDFIRAHETSNSTKEVAEKTGLSEASVQAKASKYRNPDYEKTPKLIDGKVVYRTEDGGETTDKSKTKTNSQDKPIRVMVDKLDANGNKIVKRAGIPLKTFDRSGGSRLDVDAANKLLAELRGETVAETQAETETAKA